MSIFEERESEVRSYCRSFPTVFAKAKDCILYNEEGEAYLDFFAGAGALNYGHNNDYIKKQIIDYIANDGVMHSLDMFAVAKREFLETLDERILKPRNLDYKVMFAGPTGTNAIEAAMKLVRKATGRKNIMAFTGAFHGMTMGSVSITSGVEFHESLGTSTCDTTFVPFPFGWYKDNMDCIGYIEEVIKDNHSGVEKPAAIFIECVQAEGGIRPADFEFLRRLRDLCDRYGIYLVVDDIQVGNGRSGKFFSFEWAGIVPDIVCLSKSISGYGLPLSLVLLKPELDVFRPGEHNGTFRGIQISMVGAKAALEFRDMYDMDNQVQEKAEYMDKLVKEKILSKYPQFTTRGLGLLRGIDVGDGALAKKITAQCFKNHLICERSGNYDEVIKLMPPLVVTKEQIAEGIDIILKSMDEVL